MKEEATTADPKTDEAVSAGRTITWMKIGLLKSENRYRRLERRASKQSKEQTGKTLKSGAMNVEPILVRRDDCVILRGYAQFDAALDGGVATVLVEVVDVADGEETWDYLADRYGTTTVMDSAGKGLLAWELRPFEMAEAKRRMSLGGQG